MIETILFLILGLISGTLGSLIGLGGGFVIVPTVLFFYPQYSVSFVSALSMLCVVANGFSGSIAAARKQSIHYGLGLKISLIAIPGIFLGLFLANKIPREIYEVAFGFLLVGVSIYMFLRSTKHSGSKIVPESIPISTTTVTVSIATGTLASFLGIGGGIIYVPYFSQILKLPMLLSTGTSQFILTLTGIVTLARHFQNHQYSDLPHYVPGLILGILIGAQIGVRLARKISTKNLVKIFSVFLILIAIKLIVSGGLKIDFKLPALQ